MVHNKRERVTARKLEKQGVKQSIQAFFQGIVENSAFLTALLGHVSDGPVTMQRVQTVRDRIKQIINQ